MKRLFAIGCSYTNYNWPTWADWLGGEFDEYYNFGRTGAGNRYIGSMLGFILPKLNLTEDDTVVVQWGSLLRYDTYSESGKWGNACGNMYNQNLYDISWVRKYFYPEQMAFETISYVNLVKAFLSNSKCKWTMFWLLNPNIDEYLGEPFRLQQQYRVDSEKIERTLQEIRKNKKVFYDNFLESDLSLFQLDFNTPMFHNGQKDSHPTSVAHLEYAKYITKNLGATFNLNKYDQLAKEWDFFKSNLETTDQLHLQPSYPTTRNDNSKWMQ